MRGSFVPLLDHLRGYSWELFRSDLTAGITTAIMLVPQGMGYAMLAGLPPIHGLYAALLPIVAYALVGTSRQLAVGPVALDSLLVAAGVGALAESGTDAYVAYATLLALMVGGLHVLMAVARLGFLVGYLSPPVVSGFTSAAALIIGLSQLKHILGFDIPRSKYVHEVLWNALARIEQTHVVTCLIGVLGVAALVGLKRWRPKFPSGIAVVAVATILVAVYSLDTAGVRIVGVIPTGFPAFRAPALDFDRVLKLFPTAVIIALVAVMEAFSVASKYAQSNGYALKPSRELLGIGAANIAGSFTQGYPVTGGFSRTAVNAQAGAKTAVASLITAGMVAATLLLLTPLFYYLPQATLASIIMAAVFGLIDLKEPHRLWRENRIDFTILALTFVATLSLGIVNGVLLGLAASFLVETWRTRR